jgi:HAD superfamily hydrolase (TIGR01509 family)
MADAPGLDVAPQLVIFDCDGVLVDSEPISNEVLAAMITAEGVPMRMAEARRTFQGLMLSEVRAVVEAALGRSLPEDWLKRFERERERAFRRELRPVPGAREAVQRIATAGVAVCVASQGKLEKTALSLRLTGLDRLFPQRTIFSAYSVAKGKPAPDLFLHAASTMGAQASACVVVEDTPSGVSGAVAAGMRTLGYAADSDERALRHAGAEIIHSHDALPRVLELD